MHYLRAREEEEEGRGRKKAGKGEREQATQFLLKGMGDTFLGVTLIYVDSGFVQRPVKLKG